MSTQKTFDLDAWIAAGQEETKDDKKYFIGHPSHSCCWEVSVCMHTSDGYEKILDCDEKDARFLRDCLNKKYAADNS